MLRGVGPHGRRQGLGGVEGSDLNRAPLMAGGPGRRLRGLRSHLRPAAPSRSTPSPAEIYWGERIAPAIETARNRPSVRIVQVTDTHTSAQPPSFASGGQLAADISAVIERERPDMVLVTGDLTDRGRTAVQEVRIAQVRF